MEKLKLRKDVRRFSFALTLACLLLFGMGITALAQSTDDQDEQPAPQRNTAQIALRLSSRDPLERQRAAEQLADLSAVDQRKMVEGQRLQEQNGRVRLALDWALYRMGKREALFNIVRDLDSSRRNQARAYLTRLDSPAPLYIFFGNVDPSLKARLLEVLASIGDAETLERIQPYQSSLDKRVADAAKFAVREINLRLAKGPQTDLVTRPRQVGKGTETSP